MKKVIYTVGSMMSPLGGPPKMVEKTALLHQWILMSDGIMGIVELADGSFNKVPMGKLKAVKEEEEPYSQIDFTDEKIALEQFQKGVGDEGIFPNHSDKDIWVKGFIAGIGVERTHGQKAPAHDYVLKHHSTYSAQSISAPTQHQIIYSEKALASLFLSGENISNVRIDLRFPDISYKSRKEKLIFQKEEFWKIINNRLTEKHGKIINLSTIYAPGGIPQLSVIYEDDSTKRNL